MFVREKELGKKHDIFYILPVCLGIIETLILKEEMSVEVNVGINLNLLLLLSLEFVSPRCSLYV